MKAPVIFAQESGEQPADCPKREVVMSLSTRLEKSAPTTLGSHAYSRCRCRTRSRSSRSSSCLVFARSSWTCRPMASRSTPRCGSTRSGVGRAVSPLRTRMSQSHSTCNFQAVSVSLMTTIKIHTVLFTDKTKEKCFSLCFITLFFLIINILYYPCLI